jgi:amino-acid N-acetyltransferase
MPIQPDILDQCQTRAMQPNESKQVADILESYAKQAVLLWRTQEDIQEHAGEFLIIEYQNDVIGCLALRDYGNSLMEIRSLAVKQEFSGCGCGTLIIQKSIEVATLQGVNRLFALTMRPSLFIKNGFQEVDKEQFPQKVWRDCESCPKKDHCIEVAVVLTLP